RLERMTARASSACLPAWSSGLMRGLDLADIAISNREMLLDRGEESLLGRSAMNRHPPPEATLRRHELAVEQHVELPEAPLLDLDLSPESHLQLCGPVASTRLVAAGSAVEDPESERRSSGLRRVGHCGMLAIQRFSRPNQSLPLGAMTHVFDADGHICEPPRVWEEYAEGAFRDRVLQVRKLGQPWSELFAEGHGLGVNPAPACIVGRIADDVDWSEILPGSYE